MDFLKAYDAVSAAERATPMELRDQTTGEVIAGTDGKPAIVLVKTLQCAAAIELQRAESAVSMAEAMANDEIEPRFDLNKIEAKSQRTAEALIAGFENLVTDDGAGGMRPLTVADAAAFVRLNRFSEAHMWREVLPAPEGEAAEEKAAREAAWLEPSFAQQVIGHARRLPRFLAGSATA